MSAFTTPNRYIGMKRHQPTKTPFLLGDYPLAYHITFTCYGTHLHGDFNGSVNYRYNKPGSERISPNQNWENHERKKLKQAPYEMDASRRDVVLAAILEVCEYRRWFPYAVHIRRKHVHTVVRAECPPEKAMNDFKAYASRALNKAGFDGKDRKRWTRHGSTQYKWTDDELETAVDYVVRRQGEPMAVYCAW